MEMLKHNIIINRADSEIKWVERDNEAGGIWEHEGNITDCALLVLAHDLGYDYRKVHPELKESLKILKTYPFSSLRKRQGLAVELTREDGTKFYRLYMKG